MEKKEVGLQELIAAFLANKDNFILVSAMELFKEAKTSDEALRALELLRKVTPL